MVRRAEQAKRGIVIKITTDRKHGNGGKRGGRKNSTGKKAVVTQNGGEPISVREGTMTDLLKAVRARFSISPSVRINEKGETHI